MRNFILLLLLGTISTETPNVVGSWKLLEIEYLEEDRSVKQQGIEYGRVLFTERTYAIMYNPTLKERTPFEQLSKPTEAEILAGFKSIVFNSGTYQIENDEIITTADLAKVPGFEGGKQVYQYRIHQKDTLYLTMYDETYPDGGKPSWAGRLKIKMTFIREP